AKVPDVDAQLVAARAHRAELLAAHGLIAAEAAELENTDNKRRAAVDLVARVGTTGFAGTFAATDATAGITPDPAYTGALATSLNNTLRPDLYAFVGLRIELPLGNSEA